MKPTLSFLIPAYNDEGTIGAVVRKTDRVGRDVASAYEILVIDDASTDGTVRVLTALRKTYPALRVKRHARNRGYGATIRELYFAGANEWLFTIPGDYQIGPEEVTKLLPYLDRADMIIGWRKERFDPSSRLRQSWVYNTLLRLLFGLTLHDVNSVRLMRSGMMHTVKLTSSSAFVDAELAIRAVRMGFRVIEVPISHRQREGIGGGGSMRIILPTIVDLVRFRFGRTL
jgi:dolichol-phosphate mannosyltransferase